MSIYEDTAFVNLTFIISLSAVITTFLNFSYFFERRSNKISNYIYIILVTSVCIFIFNVSYIRMISVAIILAIFASDRMCISRLLVIADDTKQLHKICFLQGVLSLCVIYLLYLNLVSQILALLIWSLIGIILNRLVIINKLNTSYDKINKTKNSIFDQLGSLSASLRINLPILISFFFLTQEITYNLSFAYFLIKPIGYIFPLFSSLIYKKIEREKFDWLILLSIFLPLIYALPIQLTFNPKPEFFILLCLQACVGNMRNVLDYRAIYKNKRNWNIFQMLSFFVGFLISILVIYNELFGNNLIIPLILSDILLIFLLLKFKRH